jgi:CubicO group peptidase (beta-lactamase class C family)
MRPDGLDRVDDQAHRRAVLMLQDEGKLKVTDPVAKSSEFAGSDFRPARQPHLAQILTHTGWANRPRSAAGARTPV